MLKGTMKELRTAAGLAFAAYETGSAAAPGVMMVHEWWGLTDGVKRIADELATHGLRVLAVDLYGGNVATTREAAGAAMNAMDRKSALEKCNAAVSALAEDGRKVGTIGWCMGGGFSLRASLAQPAKVAATCVYYGLVSDDAKEVATLRSVLGIFAEKDGWITKEMAESFDRALTTAKVDHLVRIFPADHAFANPSSANHDSGCAADAWRLTTEFFEKKLRA
jgi:carboxymethylenebutenolidase